MTADVSLPDAPRGVEWLELGTLLSLVVTGVIAAWIGGYQAGASATAVIGTVAPPSVAVTALKWTLLLSVLFPTLEIVAKRIADSAGDGADAQAESDTQAQPTESD